MKYESTNITLIANEDMQMATVGQNGKAPAFIEYQHLEELRDLLNDYFEELYGNYRSKSQTPQLSS